jgi:hypothetical protein
MIFMTFHILGIIIIPTVTHSIIFQMGWYTTNQDYNANQLLAAVVDMFPRKILFQGFSAENPMR